MARTEKQKMLAGELYWAADAELLAERRQCRALLRAFNGEPDEEQRSALLRETLGVVGEGAAVEPPFACDYGYNISIGAHVFINYHAVILDCAPVMIGDLAQIGSGVQLLAADHPREPHLRRRQLESALPITIGPNVWIGSGALVCPGVTIGEDSIIGAGSVVTCDIPAGVVAVGAPCRVMRSL